MKTIEVCIRNIIILLIFLLFCSSRSWAQGVVAEVTDDFASTPQPGVQHAAGLFANTVGTIKNVKLVNPNVSGVQYVGAAIGYIYGHVENCHVEGGQLIAKVKNEDDGDKVGGIVGYVGEGGFSITNCSVMNTTVQAYREVAGLIGCAQNGTLISGNIVDNVIVIANQLDAYKEVKEANSGELIGRKIGTMKESDNMMNNVSVEELKNVEGEVNKVKTFTALSVGTKAGANVTFATDMKGTATSGGYKKAGIVMNGGMLDGQGKKLHVEQANGTWDAALYTTGGTINNLTISGGFRGIFTAGCSSDIIMDHVVFDNVCYTFSSDGANAEYSVLVTNSTLNGWTSYTNGYKSVSFTNCKFGKGTGAYQYAYCRPYNLTTFTDCTFSEGFEFDATKAAKIVFKNCYVEQTLITADNIVSLLGQDAVNVTFE